MREMGRKPTWTRSWVVLLLLKIRRVGTKQAGQGPTEITDNDNSDKRGDRV